MGLSFFAPETAYNFDNAAMIGAAGYMAHLRKRNIRSGRRDARYLKRRDTTVRAASNLRADTVVSKLAVDHETVLSFGSTLDGDRDARIPIVGFQIPENREAEIGRGNILACQRRERPSVFRYRSAPEPVFEYVIHFFAVGIVELDAIGAGPCVGVGALSLETRVITEEQGRDHAMDGSSIRDRGKKDIPFSFRGSFLRARCSRCFPRTSLRKPAAQNAAPAQNLPQRSKRGSKKARWRPKVPRA